MKKTQLKPIDAPVYSYLQALVKSFYSKQVYIDVANRWKGLGIIYLLITVAIFSIPYSLKISYDIGHSFEEQLVEPLKQLPLLYVQNGTLNFDEPMPYLIKNPKGEVVTIIDSTGKITTFLPEYPQLTLLFKKDELLMRIPSPVLFNNITSTMRKEAPLVQPYGKGSNWVFNGAKIAEDTSIFMIKVMSQVLPIPMLIILITVVLAVIYCTIAMMGQLISYVFFSFTISYSKACRLLVVSGTPMLLCLLFLMTINSMFTGSGILLLLLLLFYYNFALFAVRMDSKRLVRT